MNKQAIKAWVNVLRQCKEQAVYPLRDSEGALSALGALCEAYRQTTGLGAWTGLSFSANKYATISFDCPRPVYDWIGTDNYHLLRYKGQDVTPTQLQSFHDVSLPEIATLIEQQWGI